MARTTARSIYVIYSVPTPAGYTIYLDANLCSVPKSLRKLSRPNQTVLISGVETRLSAHTHKANPFSQPPPPFDLSPPQRQVENSRDDKRHLEPNVPCRLRDGPRVPHLGHAGHDEREAEQARQQGGAASGEGAADVPGGVVVRVVAHAAEDDELDEEHGVEAAGPVADEGEEVLEALLPGVGGAHGAGDHDGEGADDEEEAMHAREPGEQHLQVQRDAVHGDGYVADDGQRQQHEHEAAEAARGREQLGHDAADAEGLVRGAPARHVGHGAADGGAEDEQRYRGDEHAGVVAREDGALAGRARVVVDGVVGDGAAKGEEVAGDEPAVGEHLGRGGGRDAGGLEVEVAAAAADGDDDGDEVGDPAPAVEDVQGAVAEERGGEAHEADDDDADARADVRRVQGGDALPANDGRDDGEARHRRGVEQEGDGGEVEAEGVAGLDLLAEARLRAAHAHEGRWDAGEDGEEEDDQGGVAEGHAEGERGEHAGGEANCPGQYVLFLLFFSSGFSLVDGKRIDLTYGSRHMSAVNMTVKRFQYLLSVLCSKGTGLMPFSSMPTSSIL